MTTTTTWPMTADGKYLVLRTVDADWRSHGEFRWRKTVETVASDWDPNPDRDCGGGLHGLLWGCGDAGLLASAPDAVWLVVAVRPTDVVNPDQPHKVRFRAGKVVHSGTRDEAVSYLMMHGAAGLPVVYGRHTAGDRGTSISGYGGTSTSGYLGTSTSGYRGTSTSGGLGTSTSGYRGTSTSGHDGMSTSGDRGTSTSGHYGTSTSGDGGTSTVGHYGTSTSGDRGTSTSGHGGTSTSGVSGTSTTGDGGTSTSGVSGTSTTGDGGTLIITWHDGTRYRLAVGYVGEDGIEADTPYQLDAEGRFVEVQS